MEGKVRNVLLFLTILLISFPSHSLTFRYQTLIVNPLPSAPTLSWPGSESESITDESESVLEPGSETTTSFSLQLLHVDALSSTDASPEQLFDLRIRRDTLRVETLTNLAAYAAGRNAARPPRAGGGGFTGPVISGLSQGSGEYFTRLGVGTPAKDVYMVLDTGSDVVWLQCSPCKSCFNQSDPVFDPKMSRTFAGVPCGSRLCQTLDSPGCNSRRMCLYQVSYGDGSFTVGDFSTETLSFSGRRVERVALGCGHDNEGLFVGAAGLLGLGRGGLSFPTQTKNRFNGIFSYCLVDRSASTKPSSIVFGNDAVPRTNAVFTPLHTNPKLDTFYYVELLGISVGGTRVPGLTPSLFQLNPDGDGGVIVDSGTSVTRLTQRAYVSLRDAFRVAAARLRRAPEYSLFDTCFDLSGSTTVKVPTVAFHFRGGDLALPAANYLVPVDRNGRFCFAFAGTTGGLSIIGNIQQQGFRVVYDLAGSRVGFAPRGC